MGNRPAHCPHCGQPLPAMRFGVRLGPTAARIFDAVQRAGRGGIDACMRVGVHGIIRIINNELLFDAPMRIRYRAGRYRIERAQNARVAA
jgi:hypothetical protein